MKSAPFHEGDFVWVNFPQREAPITPGPRHIAYSIAVTGQGRAYQGMLAYTTSKPWPGALPEGVRRFSEQQAKSLGQERAFVLDLRRIAWIPITEAWFPYLNAPDHGIVGQAPDGLRRALSAEVRNLYEHLERLGPLWP